MSGLQTYDFPSRPPAGLLFGLTASRLLTLASAAVVFVAAMSHPSLPRLAVAAALIGLLLAAATVPVGGRVPVEWVPVVAGYGWARATGNDRFRASPDLGRPADLTALDLPGELDGLRLVPTTVATAGAVRFGVVEDRRRQRMVAVAEIDGGDFLFLDGEDQQTRIGGWGRTLDHIAQTLPDIVRIQVVHTTAPTDPTTLTAHATAAGRRGTDTVRDSYDQVMERVAATAQSHRTWLAIALDLRAARAAVRRAGGGSDGATRVLLDRAATVEDLLASAGIVLTGWLAPAAVAGMVRDAYTGDGTPLPDVDDVELAATAAGPTAVDESWRTVRHDGGWSATVQIVQPPTRPVPGDVLQHLLIGLPGRHRMSILSVPTAQATAERRAQTQQVTAESEAHLRHRLGFGASARQYRHRDDAARREADVVDGRTVHQVTWLLTVTADTLDDLERDLATIEAAARRCSLITRRLVGTQRQAFGFTLPLCRGAR